MLQRCRVKSVDLLGRYPSPRTLKDRRDHSLEALQMKHSRVLSGKRGLTALWCLDSVMTLVSWPDAYSALE